MRAQDVIQLFERPLLVDFGFRLHCTRYALLCPLRLLRRKVRDIDRSKVMDAIQESGKPRSGS